MKKRIFDFIGFNKEDVLDLGKKHKKHIFHLCIAVLFTGFVSAVLIAFTVNTLFEEVSTGAILFVALLWFLLVVFMDRAIVTSKKTDSDILRMIRLGVIVGFVIIHSGALDLEFFKGDIKTTIAQTKEKQIDAIEEKFVPELDKVETQIQSIYDINTQIENKISEGRRNIYDEIHNGNGTTRGSGVGKIAKAKIRLFKADSLEYNASIEKNMQRIKGLTEQKAAILARKQAAIERLPSYNDTGMVTRLSALHDTVFGESTDGSSKLPIQLYYFAFLVVAIIIEGLPLIAKITYRKSVEAYHTGSDKDCKLHSDVKDNRIDLEKTEETVSHNVKKKKILSGVSFKMDIASEEAQMEGQITFAKTIEKHLDATIELETNAKEKYSDEHYKYFEESAIKPIYASFLSRSKSSNQSAPTEEEMSDISI